VTPNSTVVLPGATYSGPDPDGFMTLEELISHFETWAESFRPPVLEETQVSQLEPDPGGGWTLRLEGRDLQARSVVVATGSYQKAHQPKVADTLPTNVQQLFAEEYKNPDRLPPGAVLIVGSGQTGCQLAEELREAGRTVFLSCGRCPWFPRRADDGRDSVLWMNESGFVDRTPDVLPSPAARLVGNPQTSGHRGGHDLHFRTLHAIGVELLGRYAGAEGSTIHFADDLAASVDFGDAKWAELRVYMDAYCKRVGKAPPRFPPVEPMRIKTRAEVDLIREGVGSVIWTAGFRPDYGWVKAKVFDDMGFPIQVDGRTTAPGLYFVGVHWMRKQKSAILYGVGEDAQVVAEQITGVRA
jgi:putative flavoprotein involved in K+ transport